MGKEEKGVVVWESPAPHSLSGCGVQAKPSWNLCIWEASFSFSKGDSIAKPFLVPSLPEAPLLGDISSVPPPQPDFVDIFESHLYFWVDAVGISHCRTWAGFDALRGHCSAWEQGFGKDLWKICCLMSCMSPQPWGFGVPWFWGAACALIWNCDSEGIPSGNP